MIAAKLDPQLFFQQPDNVALRVPASEIFGLLKRSLALPGQWGAMVTRGSGDHLMVRAGGAVESADAEEVLFARMTPVEVSIEETDVASKDGFLCRASVRMQIGLVPERSELLTFCRAILGGHRVAQAALVAKFLQPTLHAALSNLAAEHDASHLADSANHDGAVSAIIEALQGPLFSAGLTLEGRPGVTFESDALRQVRRTEEEGSRRRAEHETARQVQVSLERAQGEHLDHLASTLTRLKQLTIASPELKLPELIRTFSERERGELYQTLFANETYATPTQWIIAADAEEILFFAPHKLDSPARRLSVNGDAGPMRSVFAVADADGHPVLYLGAATGVYRLPLDRGEPDLTLLVPDAPPVKGGFNSLAVIGDRVFASHSELGIWEWRLDDSPEAASPLAGDDAIGVAPPLVGGVATPAVEQNRDREGAGKTLPTCGATTLTGRQRFAALTCNAKAVRDVQIFDGHLFASIDNLVVSWPMDCEDNESSLRTHRGSVSTITAVCPSPAGLFAGNSDGDVLHWEKPEARPQRLHTGTGRPVESIRFLETHGVRRIIYTDTSLYVYARVLGDNYVCRYEAGGQTLRRVDVAPDLIVATNDLRDRLILWKPGEPATPFATIPISRLTRRSIQDVCLVTSPSPDA